VCAVRGLHVRGTTAPLGTLLRKLGVDAGSASLTASAGVVFARMMVETQLGVRGEAEGETSEPDHPLQLGSSLRSASACSWTQGLALAGFVALAALVLSTRSSRALLPLPCARQRLHVEHILAQEFVEPILERTP